MKTKHIVELLSLVGFVGLIIWYFGRTSSGQPTSDGGVVSTASGLINKPTTAGGDSTLMPATTGPAASATPPDLSKPDVNGNSWVNGVSPNGNPLGTVEIDSSGNFLVAASKGPATETRSGRGHF